MIPTIAFGVVFVLGNQTSEQLTAIFSFGKLLKEHRRKLLFLLIMTRDGKFGSPSWDAIQQTVFKSYLEAMPKMFPQTES